jgi:hypothetical protein
MARAALRAILDLIFSQTALLASKTFVVLVFLCGRRLDRCAQTTVTTMCVFRTLNGFGTAVIQRLHTLLPCHPVNLVQVALVHVCGQEDVQ